MLDFGTNNEVHLNNPNYRGLKEKRPKGHDYDIFILSFIYAVKNL